MRSNGYLPLFETRPARGLVLFRFYAASIFIGICFIWFYRLSYFPVERKIERWGWIGMFLAELWFSFYFFITVVVRWNPVIRYTFKNSLSSRYDEEALPGVDIFVCTADPGMEPPIMVINTVLSVMAYDYPPEKLSVYLSDDGGSDLTFYALLEAAQFSEVWLPFCRKLKVEPRSPEAYFHTNPESILDNSVIAEKWLLIKKSYEDMKMRIETITKLGKIPADIRKEHKGFREWDFVSSRRDHQTILQILIDGRDPNAMDIEGKPLPTLVYLAREKSPHYHHNFKAGALNAMIRVSSSISNAPFILNVDCDMYSNNSEAIRDALCFFLDEEKGHEIAYVQYPQGFGNLTKNEIYGSSLRVIMEMGLKYGCPVEDVLTGLSIQRRRWRSVYFNPERKAFLGVVPTTLLQSLIQHKRWSEGDLQIFLSKHCPLLYGRENMPLKLQLSYCIFLLWAVNCFATLYYVITPTFCLLKSISLFPKMSSSWSIPFLCVIFVNCAYSLVEFLRYGGTIRGWLNEQRMWMFKRTTSYFFAFIDNILKLCGFSKSAFVITGKVADDHVYQRYEQEIMEFGTTSPMFTILATLALFNLFSLIVGMKKVALDAAHTKVFDLFGLQILLCCLLVFLNLPIYQGMFFRKDIGKMPPSVTYQSLTFALLACTIAMY
ncbi:hypothetical protein REPUB_Repub16aG0089400 [Reevesia pubescens]